MTRQNDIADIDKVKEICERYGMISINLGDLFYAATFPNMAAKNSSFVRIWPSTHFDVEVADELWYDPDDELMHAQLINVSSIHELEKHIKDLMEKYKNLKKNVRKDRIKEL